MLPIYTIEEMKALVCERQGHCGRTIETVAPDVSCIAYPDGLWEMYIHTNSPRGLFVTLFSLYMCIAPG